MPTLLEKCFFKRIYASLKRIFMVATLEAATWPTCKRKFLLQRKLIMWTNRWWNSLDKFIETIFYFNWKLI